MVESVEKKKADTAISVRPIRILNLCRRLSLGLVRDAGS